jgi:hypothetical protein
MTAYETGSPDASLGRGTASDSRRSSVAADNNAALLKLLAPLLQPSGATCESRVLGGSVNEAIAQAMKDAKADLLRAF